MLERRRRPTDDDIYAMGALMSFYLFAAQRHFSYFRHTLMRDRGDGRPAAFSQSPERFISLAETRRFWPPPRRHHARKRILFTAMIILGARHHYYIKLGAHFASAALIQRGRHWLKRGTA